MATRGNVVSSEIQGLAEFRREMRALDKRWGPEIRKANNAAAQIIANESKMRASSGTGQQRKLAETIRAQSTQVAARLAIGNARMPFAAAAFMGSKHKSGWYAKPQFAGSKGRQFPEWVGNQWEPSKSLDGRSSGEPYVIGDAMRAVREQYEAAYLKALDDVYGRAFPD